MNAPSPASRLRALAAILVILAGIVTVVLIRTRGNEGTEPPSAPASDRPIKTTAVSRPMPEVIDPDRQAAPARSEIMPMDPVTLEAFQEASSRASLQLSSNNPGGSYAVSASLSARQAIAELGHDPDRTLQYWLSPQFAADLAAGDPANAVSYRRTIDNLLAVILGDQAGDADFEQILANLSPDVRQLALQRRTSH